MSVRRFLPLPLPLALLGLGSLSLALQAQAPGVADDTEMKDLLTLLNTPIISASKSAEKLSQAPATVLVLTREDLRQRGYKELDQILDDLPGMDVSRSYGADYFRNYWRGFRSDIADPFLVLVDGMDFNHLWYGNTSDPMVTFPISSIERVEVVYGPASSVYGSNAFMGVINIITRRPGRDGFAVDGILTGGSASTRIADVHATQTTGDLTFSLSARSDKGDLDRSALDKYPLTSSAVYGNGALWGASALASADSAGSPHQNTAVDARITWGATEFGFQQLILSTGYGTAYAADQSQMKGLWITNEYSYYVKHGETFNDSVTGTTLVRHRQSGLDPASGDIESSYSWGLPNGRSTFSHWGNVSSDTILSQDFEIKAARTLSFNAGIRFDDKTLQTSYDDPGQQGAGGDNAMPAQPATSLSNPNHFHTQSRGLYGQAKWEVLEGSLLHFGLRSDNNNIYGTANTIRGGYVGTYGSWGFKVLYGQAYDEPSGRYLFGGIGSTGSNASLKPERSNTTEASVSYTVKTFGVNLDVYDVNNSSKIVTEGSQVFNQGSQEVRGADLGWQWLPLQGSSQIKVWGFYSHYFKAEDTTSGVSTPSGDLSKDKLKLGLTCTVSQNLDLTLLGRYTGPRPTVLTNPVPVVAGASTVDFNLNWRDFACKGLALGLRVANLTDKFYFDPGLRSANAGDLTPGFNGAGTWEGSKGYYNSLLPQMGREVDLTVRFSF